MKRKLLMYGVLLPLFVFGVNHNTHGQDKESRTAEENARLDSMANNYRQQQSAKQEQRQDDRHLSDLRSEKNDTKARAKEAQRVGNEANDAARESKIAYRQERKAQQARKRADKQSKKAAKARAKSDRN